MMSPTIPLPPHLRIEAALVEEKSYRVRDLRTGARHVLRIGSATALVRRRLAVLGSIASPTVVPEQELLETDGRLLTLRPWIEGRPLEITDGEPTSVLALVARALEPLHAAGIAHGRIHAGNVILAADGRLYLVDGADPLPGLNASGALHAAPEQLRGEAPTLRTDVYAAALLAFEACTGRRPFVGAAWVELARRALYEGVDFTFEEASRLEQVVVAQLRRALALAPEARCANLGELLEGLRPPAAPPAPGAEPVHVASTPVYAEPAPVRVEPAPARVEPQLVTELLGKAAAATRSRIPPKRLARIALAFSLVGASAAGLQLTTGSGLEREVALLIEQEDYGQASAVLATARREGADPALLEKLEGDLDCAQGSQPACLEHYARALEEDPDLASDDTLRANTLAAFESADRRWLVAKVAAKLEGVEDELLEHARDTRYWVRWNAVRALEERGLENRIPYGVVHGLDVLHAATCSTRQRSLRKVVQLGDVEARPYLQQAKAKADRKLFGDWCLGSDLDAAIRRLDVPR